MTRYFRAIAATAVLLVASGCSTAFDPPPRPAVVSHMDVVHKQAYIANVKSTLKIFRASAQDLRLRGKPEELDRLSDEFELYVQMQVQPIAGDFEVDKNLGTRLDIAKLQLLCGLVYLELDNSAWNIHQLLGDMEQRYGNQPDVLNTAIDRNDVGFGSIREGMQKLDEWRSL